MILKRSLILFIASALSPVLLIALPQDLEIFTDFENVSGEGTIYIGVEPNVITLGVTPKNRIIYRERLSG